MKQIKEWLSKVLGYIFTKYVVPALQEELDSFAQEVVKSKLNSVNKVDVHDVVKIAEEHFITKLKVKL